LETRAGVAVASRVWSTAAMNIGRNTAENTGRNCFRWMGCDSFIDHAAEAGFLRPFQAPQITNRPGSSSMPQMIFSRLCLTQGTLPNK